MTIEQVARQIVAKVVAAAEGAPDEMLINECFVLEVPNEVLPRRKVSFEDRVHLREQIIRIIKDSNMLAQVFTTMPINSVSAHVLVSASNALSTVIYMYDQKGALVVDAYTKIVELQAQRDFTKATGIFDQYRQAWHVVNPKALTNLGTMLSGRALK